MSKRKPTRALRPSEIIRRLRAMAARWPEEYMLFSGSRLLLVNSITFEVLEDFTIPTDGGDPNEREENGKFYLDYEDA